ncbi:hypothetical protein [Candidatus Bartonella raoultii]|uniref:Uncharacterized protein n=1 Tax=Bartonella raoultii TaxID=1457020 RepID=A0ABS7I6P6_9HYPH|nr:hypothetical protein [Bartonella raoultii]
MAVGNEAEASNEDSMAIGVWRMLWEKQCCIRS